MIQRGCEGKSVRGNDKSPAFHAAADIAKFFVNWIVQHGISERQMCLQADIDRRTWRRATGRPFPSDRAGLSQLTVRDFLAASSALGLDPIKIMTSVTGDKSRALGNEK